MTQIAAQAGVTQATVSLCLANHPRISPKTRERVQALARQLGYSPHPYISSLMRFRRQGRALKDKPVLALVCAFHVADRWRNHPSVTIRHMREGALARAASFGFHAQEFWLHRDGMSADRFSDMLHARGIQGLLLGPLPDGTAAPELNWEHFAAVSLSAPLRTVALTTVCNDHYFSTLRAVSEARRHGHRRPGLAILKSHPARFHGRWEAGYLMGCAQTPAVAPLPPLLLDDWSDEKAIRQWLRREKPDAVITPGSDYFLPFLQREGWSVPEEIGLVSLACPGTGGRISGIFQNGHLMGSSAVDLLIGQIERHERGLRPQARSMMIEGEWNEGKTLRPLKAEK
jgi:LacI family transcriptional regulator